MFWINGFLPIIVTDIPFNEYRYFFHKEQKENFILKLSSELNKHAYQIWWF